MKRQDISLVLGLLCMMVWHAPLHADGDTAPCSAPQKDLKSVWEKGRSITLPKIKGKYGDAVGSLITAFPKEGGVYLVDLQGHQVGPTYERIYRPVEGFAVAEGTDKKAVILNQAGDIICQQPADSRSFSTQVNEGLWPVQGADGLWSAMRMDGSMVEGGYQTMQPFRCCLSIVSDSEGRYGMLSPEGIVIPCRYSEILPSYTPRYAWVREGKGALALLEMRNQQTIPLFADEDITTDFKTREARLYVLASKSEHDARRNIKNSGTNVENRLDELKLKLRTALATQLDIMHREEEKTRTDTLSNGTKTLIGGGNISEDTRLAVASFSKNCWGFVTLDGTLLNDTFVFTRAEDANRVLQALEQQPNKPSREDISRAIESAMPAVNRGSLYDTLPTNLWNY